MQQPNNNRQSSIRQQQQRGKRKVVKVILESPFSYQWNRLEEPYSTGILNALLEVLRPVGEYREARNARKRLERQEQRTQQQRKQSDKKDVQISSNQDSKSTEITNTRKRKFEGDDNDRRYNKDQLIIGINAVTKYLEKHSILTTSQSTSHKSNEPLLLFVCIDDIPAAHMYNHLPVLAHQHGNTFLCPLKQDSQKELSNVSSMNLVCCVAIKCKENEENEKIRDLFEMVKGHCDPVKLPWASMPESQEAVKLLPVRQSERDATNKKPKP